MIYSIKVSPRQNRPFTVGGVQRTLEESLKRVGDVSRVHGELLTEPIELTIETTQGLEGIAKALRSFETWCKIELSN